MRIAVEMPFDIEGKRGWIFYTESLLRALARLDRDNEYLVFNFFFRDYRAKRRTVYCPEAENFRLEVPRWPESVVTRLEWSLRLPVIESYLKFRGVSVFHAARIPATARIPVVTTIHDIMYVKHPEHMYPKFRWGWEHCGMPGLRVASRFITHSEHHKRELVEILGVDERRIRVILPGANTELFRPVADEGRLAQARSSLGLPERFALMIGPFTRWWCHYDAVLEALRALARDRPDFHLVLVGDDASEGARRLQGLAHRLGIEGRLRWLGRVPGESLNTLMNLALCNVYPAWDTGCSFNVLDSMAAGLPVVTSRVSLLPEMLGEAGVWADPYSPAEMEAALRRLLEDPDYRRRSSEACLARARKRSWEKAARATLEVYREAAG